MLTQKEIKARVKQCMDAGLKNPIIWEVVPQKTHWQIVGYRCDKNGTILGRMTYRYPETCCICGLEQTVTSNYGGIYGGICPDCLVSSRDYVVDAIKDHRLKILTQYGAGPPKIRGPQKHHQYCHETKTLEEVPKAEITDPQQPKE